MDLEKAYKFAKFCCHQISQLSQLHFHIPLVFSLQSNFSIISEAYKPGVKNLIAEKIPVEYGDAAEIIEKFDDNKISQIYMLFPDPWQKVKHRKRRLFNEYTFKIIDRILKRDGFFHFASDNINYAFQAKRIIEKASSRDIEFSKHRGFRPVTKYEVKGIEKRNFIFDLIYFKN